MTAIALLEYAERHLPWVWRKRRDPLAQARARLHDYASSVSRLSPEERDDLCTYEGPEVSGEIKQRRSA